MEKRIVTCYVEGTASSRHEKDIAPHSVQLSRAAEAACAMLSNNLLLSLTFIAENLLMQTHTKRESCTPRAILQVIQAEPQT